MAQGTLYLLIIRVECNNYTTRLSSRPTASCLQQLFSPFAFSLAWGLRHKRCPRNIFPKWVLTKRGYLRGGTVSKCFGGGRWRPLWPFRQKTLAKKEEKKIGLDSICMKLVDIYYNKIPSKKFVKRKKAGWMDGWRCANVSSLCVCFLFLSIGNKLFYDKSHQFNNC